MRIAIIGLGAVTRNIHLPAYARIKNKLSLVGGCDLEPAARAACASQIPQLFDNPQEMIEKTKPDIVAICTPPFLHHDQCLLALDNGCHVFCEKPLAENLQQADAMIEAARRAGRMIVVNNQFPLMNIYQAAKAKIGSPEFGRLLFMHAEQTFRPTEATEAGWRGEMARRLGFEFGVHVFDLARFFFDADPIRVLAHMPRPVPGLKSDAINFVALEFADGRAASILLDRLSKGPERYLDIRLDGEHAAIQTSIGGHLRFEAGLHTRERRPFAGLQVAGGGRALLQDGNNSRVIARDGTNPFASSTAKHLGNFIDAIQNGNRPYGLAEDNRGTIALVFAAYESAESGRTVDISA